MEEEQEYLQAIQQLAASLQRRQDRRARKVGAGTATKPPGPVQLVVAREPSVEVTPTEASASEDAPRPVSGEELHHEAHRDSERVGSDSQESAGSNLGLAGMSWADRVDLEEQLLAGESQSVEQLSAGVSQLSAGESQHEERLLAGVDQQEFGHHHGSTEEMEDGELSDEDHKPGET